MAAGLVGVVKITNPHAIAAVDQAKEAYLKMRRVMDALIAIRAGKGGVDETSFDYETLQGILDASGVDNQGVALSAAVAGNMAYCNLDAALGALKTAYDALSNMDMNAL